MEGLTSMIWILTTRCNLACRHCYVAPLYGRVNELSLDECLRVLEEAVELGVSWIGFSGGELTLDRRFKRIVERTAELGVDMNWVTNATLIDRNWARWLASVGIYTIVSLDGPGREHHEALRGPGTWSLALRGIRYLREEGAPFSIVTTVSTINHEAVHLMVNLAERLGAEALAVIPLMDVGRARGSGLAIGPVEYAKAVSRIASRASERGFHVSFWCSPFIPLIARSRYVHYYSCRLSDNIDLDPSGNIILCDTLPIPLSSVRGRRLREAWEEACSHELEALISNPPRPSECTDCPLWSFCKGGCFSRAYYKYGDLRKPDPLCPRASGVLEYLERTS